MRERSEFYITPILPTLAMKLPVESQGESDVWDSVNLNCILFLPFKINILKIRAVCVN